MEDTKEFISERKVMKQLLLLYRHHPCLWDNNHPQYGSSEIRKRALGVILKEYKIIAEDASIETLKKKIENMRASYKREYRKVLRNKYYEPSLWYYDYMKFLDEGPNMAECKSENEDENPEETTQTYQPAKSTYSMRTDELSETEAFGRTVGLQLSELSPMQKTIAEKLISEVVFYGRMEKLTTITNINNINGDCFK